jgi:hypothetical protein
MTKIGRAELTISRSLRALAIAQRHVSGHREADDSFRAPVDVEPTIALATKEASGSGSTTSVPDERTRPGAIVRPLAPHDRIRVLAAAELASASAT